MTLLSFSTVPHPAPEEIAAVGTLGPHGTSSEQAATLFARQVAEEAGPPAAVHLFDTYEGAVDALRDDAVTHVVVANAYRSVYRIYMDPSLALTNVFVMDTPLYGIAAPQGAVPVTDSPTIASHPSPEPIIAQLLSPRHVTYKVLHSDSTSAAAIAAVDGTADLALTTVPAAERYGLEFVSRTRPIRMVWSVFTKAVPDALSNPAA
jgi:prephenate dehydratase